MLTAKYSNETWGSVVALTDGTHTIELPPLKNGVPQWPIRTASRDQNQPVEIIVTHPVDGRTQALKVTFDPMTFVDIPESYQQWMADGLIVNGLFDEKPEPEEEKAARLLAEAKASGLNKVAGWFDRVSADGIQITGSDGVVRTLKGTTADATQYQAEISIAVQLGVDPVVGDVNGELVTIPREEVGAYVAAYHTELTRRRIVADTATKTIKTAEAVDAIEAALAALK